MRRAPCWSHLGEDPYDGTSGVLPEERHDGVLNHVDLPGIVAYQHLKNDQVLDYLIHKELYSRF